MSTKKFGKRPKKRLDITIIQPKKGRMRIDFKGSIQIPKHFGKIAFFVLFVSLAFILPGDGAAREKLLQLVNAIWHFRGSFN